MWGEVNVGGLKLRKQQRRLARRVAAFLAHGANPVQNPGKESPPMLMHRPGSNRK